MRLHSRKLFSFNFAVFRGFASHNCPVSSENVSSAVAEISPTERARKCRISECAIRDGEEEGTLVGRMSV